MGERQPYAPPSPSLLVSKHTSSVKKSSIWRRKKSPILGMCSGPTRYYNLTNRQAGCPLNLPLSSQSDPAFLMPVLAVLGPMDRSLLVLPVFLTVFALEPVLVHLAVGHGGSCEGTRLI